MLFPPEPFVAPGRRAQAAAIRRSRAAVLLVLLAAAPVVAQPVLSGEVLASAASPIYTPPSNDWNLVLRYYIPDGTHVEPGDVVLRIDPGQSAAQVVQLRLQIEQQQAQLAKDLAELQVKAIDAEIGLIDAEAAAAKARVDAKVPGHFRSALDADRIAGELDRAERELLLKRREFEAARDTVARRNKDAALELGKLEADLAYHQAAVDAAEVRAERAGVVVHAFDNWRGQRYDEGASSYPGQRVGEIVGPGPMSVRAYALEPDRAALVTGQKVLIGFDAHPGRTAEGRVERISGAPEAKAEWGRGRYFTVDIAMDDTPDLKLLPGMNAQIRLLGEAP